MPPFDSTARRISIMSQVDPYKCVVCSSLSYPSLLIYISSYDVRILYLSEPTGTTCTVDYGHVKVNRSWIISIMLWLVWCAHPTSSQLGRCGRPDDRMWHSVKSSNDGDPCCDNLQKCIELVLFGMVGGSCQQKDAAQAPAFLTCDSSGELASDSR